MAHIAEQKRELRQAMLERIQRMSEKDREAEGRSIVRRILEVLPADRAVCAFFPMKTEPDIRPLLAEILDRRQPLFLPAFDGRALVMRRTTDLSLLVPGTFGIPEPPPGAETLDRNAPVFVLVPGRAFDAAGSRLGRGNGGYDRWITDHRAANSQSQYFGVTYDCQIVSAVPLEEHDMPLNGYISARGCTPAQK